MSQTSQFALYSRTGVVLKLQLESTSNGRSVDLVSKYSRLKIAVEFHKPSRITRQKTCCASESNKLVRVVFAKRSGFDAPIGVILSRLGMGGAWIMSQHIPDDKSRSDLRNIHELRGKRLVAQERGSCLNIFPTPNRGQISETFTNYEAKDLLRKSVDHVSTYSGWKIAVGSQKTSRITRQKASCANESNTSVRVVFANRSSFDDPIGVVLAWEERGSCVNIFRMTNRRRILKTFTNYEAKDLLHKSVDHVSTYSGGQIAVGSPKPSRITRQKTCCTSESNTSVRVVLANRSSFDAPIGVVLAWEERGSCLNIFRMKNRGRISETFTNYEAKDLHGRSVDHVSTYSGRKIAVRSEKPSRIRRQKTCRARAWFMSQHIPDDKSWSDLRNLHELRGKRLVPKVSQTRRFALYSRIGLILILRLESSPHGMNVGHVITYSGRQIAVRSQKPSRITRQKTCWARESNTSVRVVLPNGSGFDAPIRVVSAWEERGSCLNRFWTTNRGRISETFTNYDAKDFLRNHLGLGGAWIMSQDISDEKLRSDLRNLHELRGKRLVAQMSQTRRFALYSRTGVVLMLQLESSWHGRSVDHVLTYFGRQIVVGSQKLSQITRQKTCCASESNTSVRVVFANQSGFDAPIGVVLAWEERGSCLNIFRTTNRGSDLRNFHDLRGKRLVAQERGSCLIIFQTTNRDRIFETFMNYEAKDLLRKQKTCCASESNTLVRVVFAIRSGFDAPIGVVLAWEECGSCLIIFRTKNHGRILETFMNYEAIDFLRKSVDHVSTHSGRQIAVGSQKASRITTQKTCCASESNTSVRVVFANGSGFNAPIGVILAWEERGSSLNIFWTTNRGQISGTFTNYEAKDLLRKSVDHVLTYFGTTNRGRISETFTNYEAKDLLRKSVDHVSTYSGQQIAVGSQKPSRITRQKTCCASESNTSVRVVFANQSGFDAPIGVVLAWEERGSCLKYFGRKLAVGSQKPSRIMRQKTWCASESNTSVPDVFANRSGFNAPIGVFLAWEERGSCLNIFRKKNHGRISETLTNYDAKDLLRKQKTWCASESNTSVPIVFANQSGFDAPIGVVFAWEARRSCLNIFRTTNRDRISETFTNYEAKDLLPKSVDHVSTFYGQQIAVGSQKLSQITRQKTCCVRAWIMSQHIPDDKSWSDLITFTNYEAKDCCAMSQHVGSRTEVVFDAPIGVVLAWEERGSCLNIFRTTNRNQISETFTITSKRLVAQVSQTRRFANRVVFDAPIRVVFLAWEERGSCLNIFRTTNRGRISESFTNYEAKDLFRNRLGMGGAWVISQHIPDEKSRIDLRNLHELRGKTLVAQERGSCINIFQKTNCARISETFTNYEAKDLLRNRPVMGGSWIMSQHSSDDKSWSDLRNLHEFRGKRLVAQVSQTRRFANRSGFDAPIGVVLACEEHGSCLNVFRTTNHCRISETFTNYEANDLLRKSVDHVSTYSGLQILVGSQKPSQMTTQKTCCGRAWIMSQHIPDIKLRLDLRNLHELRGKRLVAQVSQTRQFALYSRTGVVLILQLESSWHGRSVGHVSTYSGRQIVVGSQKPSRIFEAKDLLHKPDDKSWSDLRNLHVLRGKRLVAQVSQTRRFPNRSGFDAPIGVVLACEEHGSCLNVFRTTNHCRNSETFTNYEANDLLRKAWIMSNHIPDDKSRSDLGNLHELRGKRLVAQVSQTRRFANRSGLMLQLESSWHGRSMDHVSTYSGREIAVGSQKPLRITRQKTCCACESNTSVRERSGFDALIGVVLAWEERGSCLHIFRTTNPGRISETFTNYEAKDLLRNRLGTGGAWIMSQHIPDDKSRSDLGNLHELRGKRLVAQVSQTRRFANRSGFDALFAVVLAWEERGSCLNIFRTTNPSRISETFMNYEAKDLLRKSVDHVSTYSGRRVAVGSQKPSRITRQKTCCGSESNVVFANRSGFDAPIGVVLAWVERGSCLNIFQTTNRGGISETFTNYEAKDLLRSWIMSQHSSDEKSRSDLGNLHKLRGKRLVAQVSQTSRFANRSGFDAPIKVVLAREEHASCLNMFRTKNPGRILETFTIYEAKDSLRNRLGMGGAWIMSQHIPDEKSRSDLKNRHELRGKRLVAHVSQTRRFTNRSGFDALIGVVLAWEERGSCLNIFRTTNPGRISETFTNYEAKDLLRKSVDHVSTYSGRQIAVGSQKPSRITRQKTCCASESNTSVRVVFANRSGFDTPIGVVLAWEERGSCLNIFWMTNRGRISKTFTNFEAKDLLHKPDDKSWSDLRNLHVLRGKRLVAQVSQTRRFPNRSGFDAPIGVVLACEEHGSCLNVFRTTNHCRISETFTNYEANDLLRNRLGMGGAWIMSQHILDDKSRSDLGNLHELPGKRLVTQVSQTRRFANRSDFDAPIGVVLAWEEHGSYLNIFWTTNRGRISETFTYYEAKDLLRM
ncbi:uncharacterized protein G2W53_033656 [Senna tora]|uniref:Uncharacterized protein n=1 Tax=Senna tora TaxID=362788 RepID=A0A834SYS9_9FABA|nr:uncharacterized protein G2W53_033656 [Senna tora]